MIAELQPTPWTVGLLLDLFDVEPDGQDRFIGQSGLAAGTDEQHPDSQGRITLSADHRRYADLSKDCVVIGAVDFLEIWDAQAWQDYQQTHEENFSAASDEALSDII